MPAPLKIKLGLVRTMVRKDPDKADQLIGELATDADDALEILRGPARGIYPPLPADQGLPAALEAPARKASLPVMVQGRGHWSLPTGGGSGHLLLRAGGAAECPEVCRRQSRDSDLHVALRTNPSRPCRHAQGVTAATGCGTEVHGCTTPTRSCGQVGVDGPPSPIPP